MLRALGLRPRQAAGIVRWQSATQALFAVVIGLPFGLVIGRSLAGVERPGRWCGRDYRDGRVHLIMTARRRP